MFSAIIITSILSRLAFAYHVPHFEQNRSTITHLFEWKWKDIAKECEQFLGPRGFAAVQISPPNENAIIKGRPWYERYQPISYKLITRSGNEEELADMIKRCNKVGVRIYADAVINHMTADQEQIIGTAKSTANFKTKDFPAVPYTAADFHQYCPLDTYYNATVVRNCQLVGLADLDQSKPYVQQQIVKYMNHLLRLGVAGFRIDAVKHIWPEDLKQIYSKLDNLNVDFGFPKNTRPFIYQEMIDISNEAVKKTEYNALGVVTEFLHSKEIGNAFRGGNKLRWFKNWGTEWNFLPSHESIIFTDNHDNQRGHGGGEFGVLNYKSEVLYKMANVFMLAHPYGYAQIMSSYNFTDPSQGPPSDAQENIISPQFDSRGYCSIQSGWVCEHRWKEIADMVEFRNVVQGEPLVQWWDNENDQIAFGRGNKGFIVINNEDGVINQSFQTEMPAGIYCNVYDGAMVNGKCMGATVTVGNDRKLKVESMKGRSIIAIHIGAKL